MPLIVARGVHSGQTGERAHNIACSARPGTALSATLSRVHTFLLMTIPMISRISSRVKCSASASCQAPKSSTNGRIREASNREGGAGCGAVEVSLPPGGQSIDHRSGDAGASRAAS